MPNEVPVDAPNLHARQSTDLSGVDAVSGQYRDSCRFLPPHVGHEQSREHAFKLFLSKD